MNTNLTNRWLAPALFAVVALVALAHSPSVARAFDYTTCVRWQAQTIDSGFGEDRIDWANSATSLVTAYGVRIRISQGGWADTFDTSPSSGCVTWTTTRTGSFDVRVYAFVTDTNDNAMRYHDAGDDAFGTYPGNTYSSVVTGYMPSSSATTYVNVGSGVPLYTAMATASMVSRYFPGITTGGTEIHMADGESCGGSSAHHCSGSCLYSNGDTYVRLDLPTCAGSSDHRRRKFITAHELGHARAILVQESLEPNVDSGLAVGTCNDAGGYSMNSREYDSVNLREGNAHFVAAWTFNFSDQSDGFMRWFNDTFDIEANNPNLAGGRIENNCGGMTNGQSTNLDVVRMLWDWTTPNDGANKATRAQVCETYSATVDSSPSSTGYWDAFYSEAAGVVSDPVRDELQSWGCWNGVADGC
jgi:hypothetical protein